MHIICLKTGKDGDEVGYGLVKDKTAEGWLLDHRFRRVPSKRGYWAKRVGRKVMIARILTVRYWTDLPSFLPRD